ncbi:DMT family transporter [Haloferula chungangensis]|uniref:DMT family transporter n=1 Tax=Haloferula chungangensis TaxID=1048331 RepID=A0ABW2L958_9BACT
MPIGDFCAIASALVWSISVILMRVSGYQVPPLPLNFFKSSIALICLVLSHAAVRENWWPELSPTEHLRMIISAVIGISLADTMIAAALNRLGASLQALADCLYSPAIITVGFLMFGETLNTWEMIGGALVISGVFVGATMTAEVKHPRDLWTGVALAAGAHVLMAVGILMVRDIYIDGQLFWLTGYRFLVAIAVLFIWSLLRYGKRMPEVLFTGFRRRDTWFTTIPMAILGPFLATLLWVTGFKYLIAGRAAIYNQLSTVFIIVLAYFFLKEKFTTRKAIGTGLALLGSLLVAMH